MLSDGFPLFVRGSKISNFLFFTFFSILEFQKPSENPFLSDLYSIFFKTNRINRYCLFIAVFKEGYRAALGGKGFLQLSYIFHFLENLEKTLPPLPPLLPPLFNPLLLFYKSILLKLNVLNR